jgi:hypothetical protein
LTNTITLRDSYFELPINTGKFRTLGVYTKLLKGIYDQIHALLSHHSRITIAAFNLHLPVTDISTPSSSNQLVTEFFKRVKEQLGKSQWGSHTRVIHFWTREVGKTEKGHYHCFIGIKHSMVRPGGISSKGYTGIWKLLEIIWKELTGGFLRPTKYHTVNRGNVIQLSTAFYHLSYAAKVRDKDFGTGETHKRYSASRLKSKNLKATSSTCVDKTPLEHFLFA